MDKIANEGNENDFLKAMIKELTFYILRQPYIKIDNEKDLEIKKIIEFVQQMVKNDKEIDKKMEEKKIGDKIVKKIIDFVLKNEDNFKKEPEEQKIKKIVDLTIKLKEIEIESDNDSDLETTDELDYEVEEKEKTKMRLNRKY